MTTKELAYESLDSRNRTVTFMYHIQHPLTQMGKNHGGGEEMDKQGQINISITGTVFIALALFGVLSLGIGEAFNRILPGSGDTLVNIGIISFVVLVISVIIAVLAYQYQ